MAEANSKIKDKVTVEDLMWIIEGEQGFVILPDRAYDLVYPGIYIGEGNFAKSIHQLKKEGITHVLNVAEGTSLYHVNIDSDLYKDTGIRYKGIKANDSLKFNFGQHFEEIVNFIDEALLNKGVVLVNCKEGISRSATSVIAYLMLKKNMNLVESLKTIKEKRNVCPNEKFLEQLIALEQNRLDYCKNDTKNYLTIVSGPVLYACTK